MASKFTALQTEENDDVGTCAVCLLAFSASDPDHLPRLLLCGHSFCTACLIQICTTTTATRPAPTAEAEQATCRCPKCRTVTRLEGHGAAGVHGLPRNFDLIDLLSHHHHHQHTRPPAAAPVRSCGGCGQQAADRFCEACGGVHLCVSCDTQLHALLMNRSHARVASADAPEPRAACQHHAGKKVEMWCERDAAAVCVVCLVVGPHKGHDAVTIEEAEARMREAARAELARVEAAIGEVDAAMLRAAVREADELKSAEEARAALKRHFDQMREAAAQRERALGVEIDEWARARVEAAAKQRGELGQAKRQLEAAGKAIQQHQQQPLETTTPVGAVAEEVYQAATTAATATNVSTNCIAFVGDGAIERAVGSSGHLVSEQATTNFGGAFTLGSVPTNAPGGRRVLRGARRDRGLLFGR